MNDDTAKFDFDEELQFKILQLCVQDYQWATSVGLEIIEARFFDNEMYGKIFDWVKYLMQKYNTDIKMPILKDCATKVYNDQKINLEQKVLYDKVIERLYDSLDDFSAGIDYLKERALEFAKKEKFRQGLQQSVNLLKMDPDAYEQAIPLMEKALSVGSGLDLGMDLKRDILNLPQILGKKYDKVNMVSTGLKGLDEAIGGGWINGTLSLIAAPSGGGKSRAMAYFAAEALKQGKKVIYITLELDEDETLANVVSSLTNRSWWEMLNPDPIVQEDYQTVATNVRDKLNANLKVKFYINKTISTQTIMAYIMRLKSSEGFVPDLIVVDYMDLLLPIDKPKTRGEESDYAALGIVCFDLIRLGKMFNIPIISGSQLNRTAFDITGNQVVSMASLSDSSRKIFNCHNLLTMNRNPQEKELGKCRIYLAKARTGKQNEIIYCNYDLSRCKIEEVQPYDPTEEVDGMVNVKQVGGK